MRRELFDESIGCVRATVSDHDKLKISPGLSGDAVQRSRDRACCVVCREDDRNQRFRSGATGAWPGCANPCDGWTLECGVNAYWAAEHSRQDLALPGLVAGSEPEKLPVRGVFEAGSLELVQRLARSGPTRNLQQFQWGCQTDQAASVELLQQVRDQLRLPRSKGPEDRKADPRVHAVSRKLLRGQWEQKARTARHFRCLHTK